MKVLFHENQLTYRGTSNAIYNYAVFNEEILGNKSVIVHDKNNKANFALAIARFKKRFKVISYESISELEDIVKKEEANLFYAIKAGKQDGVKVTNCKTAIHVVFKNYDPHGDVYAYVSEWLSEEMTNGKYPYVPHMIYVEPTQENLREQLGIPQDAIVFGRHGGNTTFDISFVKKVIKKISRKAKRYLFPVYGNG